MSYHLDEYDLERSHELERRLDRDAEREPYGTRTRRTSGRSRYFNRVLLHPVANGNDIAAGERKAA